MLILAVRGGLLTLKTVRDTLLGSKRPREIVVNALPWMTDLSWSCVMCPVVAELKWVRVSLMPMLIFRTADDPGRILVILC